ncbi:hypothetical protein GBA52_022331 [Prunus armeniaca]|nr:hypothetical protein GBA52_022331 [Prunus armeniaca]
MASQPSSRKAFIDSSINISRSYNFHVLDINWEFPGPPTDVSNFGILLAELRALVPNESETSGRPPLLLVAASTTLQFITHCCTRFSRYQTTWTGSM